MYPRNCTLLMSIVLKMYMFQVRENDIWNDLDRHNLMQNFGSDHTTFVYMKRRAMETIAKLLETRTNLHGYAYQRLFICFGISRYLIYICLVSFLQVTGIQVSRCSGRALQTFDLSFS